jgi:hypothetical protein
MPTGHTTPLPLSTWDRETLVAVALTYRRMHRLGALDLPARQAAEAAYLERHPGGIPADAQQTVALMISAVARDHPAWLWKESVRSAEGPLAGVLLPLALPRPDSGSG